MSDAIELEFPNGSRKSFPAGTSGKDIAASISGRLAKEALAVSIDDTLIDLDAPLQHGGRLEIHTFTTRPGREVFWHSSAHIMAQAVTDLFPNTKLAIGPPIDEGFYYDFDVEKPLSDDDLARIEKRMQEIIEGGHQFTREAISKKDAIKRARRAKEDYKLEMLAELEDGTITYYHHDTFSDLCRGPHIPSTSRIKAFKLLSVAGAYWRGDENKKMLQRIYGVSYPKKSMLDDFLKRLEEAKRRDHRKLGRELGLFAFTEETGGGLPLWLPKGALMRSIIEQYWRDMHLQNGYDLVMSPHIARLKLWETSGHTDFYSEDMYSPMKIDNDLYQVKPMNCPFHIMMYKQGLHSYRELPIRWAELGTVYRYERGGVLHGLFRVRGFTQDDAHIFCTPDQLEAEIIGVLDLTEKILSTFGFTEYQIYLSTRPEKAIGEPEQWQKAEDALRRALSAKELAYDVDEGGGAFYGPKIDIKIRDAMHRAWQCTTVQFDFNLPERFDLTYIDSNGESRRPFMVHRAILGAIERFFGVLIEHFGGYFPLWLAPVQAVVLPITDKQADYAFEILKRLRSVGIRGEIDKRAEKIGFKIREAEVQKIPYMLVVGQKEADNNSVALRHHGEGDLGALSADEAINRLSQEIAKKSLPATSK